ncbi:MAG TPA: glycosyltransferase, partial [Anaerolineae bacterium]
MINLFALIYLLTMAGLSLYGFAGLLTLCLYWRHRQQVFPCPPVPSDLPPVTVQLPIYNERFVVDRLIESAVALDYPPDRLQIQVIDDSTDGTTGRAAELVRHYEKKGVNISLLHRQHRQGYKAGALSGALMQAQGEFIAIFDADFQPSPSFLRQTIPHFLHEPALGLVQTRWGHLNAHESALTAAQAIALDKHFVMEQTVRHRANLFPKFNGAAGVWRRRCLEMAGGWHDDTVCEDLCLSTRAILQGWQFLFLNDVVAPAELPDSILA